MITDNILLKVGGLFGSAYALFEVSNNLVKVHGSELDLVRGLVASPTIQMIMGYLFAMFIAIFVSFAIQYIFLIGPTIVRAQMLDDILLMALEEKRFADRTCGATSPAQKTDGGKDQVG
jgi:hypothetical protein